MLCTILSEPIGLINARAQAIDGIGPKFSFHFTEGDNHISITDQNTSL